MLMGQRKVEYSTEATGTVNRLHCIRKRRDEAGWAVQSSHVSGTQCSSLTGLPAKEVRLGMWDSSCITVAACTITTASRPVSSTTWARHLLLRPSSGSSVWVT